MHHPTDRITHTTAFVTPVVDHWLERVITQWVHPTKDRSDDPSHHERTLLPLSCEGGRILIVVAVLIKKSSFTGAVSGNVPIRSVGRVLEYSN